MSQTKYFYLYKIVNKQTGAEYTGVHETTNLDDGYMGSGIVISRAIRKYGRELFDKTIIEFFDSRDDMYKRESEIVTEEYIKQPHVMNVAAGGYGGSMFQNQKPFAGPHSETTKRRISQAGKGRMPSDVTREKLRANNFARKDPVAQREHAIRAGKARWDSSERPERIEETKKKISETLKRWNELNSRSEHTKQKIIESQRQRRERERQSSIRKIWIYHPQERLCKMIDGDAEIPLGWVKGRKMTFE